MAGHVWNELGSTRTRILLVGTAPTTNIVAALEAFLFRAMTEMGLSLLVFVLAVLLRKNLDLLSKNRVVKKLPDLEVLSLDHGIITGPFAPIGRVSLILHRKKKLDSENRNILRIKRFLHVDKI